MEMGNLVNNQHRHEVAQVLIYSVLNNVFWFLQTTISF